MQSHRMRVLACREITPPNHLDGRIRFCLSFLQKFFWQCFFLKQFSSIMARWSWCKIHEVLFQHLREHSATFSISQPWSWKRPWGLGQHSWPGSHSWGDHTCPLVTAQAACRQQLHSLQMVGDRHIFYQNKGLHRKKQLSRFQRKLLLVIEMMRGVL